MMGDAPARYLVLVCRCVCLLLCLLCAGAVVARAMGSVRGGGTQLVYSRTTVEAGILPSVDLIDTQHGLHHNLNARYNRPSDAIWLSHDLLLLKSGDIRFTLVRTGGSARTFTLPAFCDPTRTAISRTHIACTPADGLSVMRFDLECLAAHCTEPPTLLFQSSEEIIDALVWSPDERHIALSGSLASAPGVIILDSASGDGSRRFATAGHWMPLPAWSPDGSQLALYLQADRQMWLAVYDVRADHLRRIVPIIGYWPQDPPTWSPTGREIAFYLRDDFGADLYVLDVVDEQTRRLAGGNGILVKPHWSPDGRQIASFINNRRGGIGVYLVDAADGALSPFIMETRLDVSYSWRPCRQAGC
jgi:hypothetical protein